VNREHNTEQKSRVTVEAVVYPPCVCGRPYPEHTQGGVPFGCVGYRPSRPIEDKGVIAGGDNA
jgi:hypothetical protein